MIRFVDIMQKLADHGYSSYELRRKKILSEGTMTRLRNEEPITTVTIDTVCRLCECQPGDLMSWEPDPEE